jgi:hypothetical protein
VKGCLFEIVNVEIYEEIHCAASVSYKFEFSGRRTPSASGKEWASLISQRPSVEVLNRNAFQVDSFEAANIDRAHLVTLWIGTFSVRVYAARRAKAVLDDMLVERVRADVLVRCEHVQLIARHEPKERSFAGTHRAIACHRTIEFALDLEPNLAAVTASLILHVSPPWIGDC